MTISLVLILTLFIACASKEALPSAPVATAPLTVDKETAKEGQEVEWEELKIQAKKEGKVVVGAFAGYNTKEALMGPLKTKFGLNLEWITAPGPTLVAKVTSERNAGVFTFDILITGPDTPYRVLRPQGIIKPLDDWLLLPEVKDPKVWLGGKLLFYDEEHTILTMTATPTGHLTINPKLVDINKFKSLQQDLLDPKWKGKIVMHSPKAGGSGRRWATEYMDILGPDFLKQLVNQEPILIDSHRLAAEWVARDKYSIGIAISADEVISFIEAGSPVAMLYPSEGIYLASAGGNVMVLDQAPHPKATKVFINWLLSREGQILWSKGGNEHTARVDIKTEELEIYPYKIRQPGVKYYYTLSREFSSVRHDKAINEIFAPLLR